MNVEWERTEGERRRNRADQRMSESCMEREKVREKAREKAREKKALVEYMKSEDNVWVVQRERVEEEAGLCGRRMFVE